LRHTLKKRDPEKCLIRDAGLCHGSAGVAHIYRRIWEETGEEDFAKSGYYWFKYSLKLATFPDGLAGFKTWRAPENGGWANDPGLLEGVTGIGLAFLSAVYPVESDWDRCLLLS